LIVDIIRFPTCDDGGPLYDLDEMQELEKLYLKSFPKHLVVYSLDNIPKKNKYKDYFIKKVIDVLSNVTQVNYHRESIVDILKIKVLDSNNDVIDVVKAKQDADDLNAKYMTAFPEKIPPCILPFGVTVWQYANQNDLIHLLKQLVESE